MAFQRAVKTQRPLKMALFGPSGSGKTYSALRIATAFAPNGRIAVIDTERNSSSLYADDFTFDTSSLARYGVDDYVALIKEADQAGYDFLIIDSISHAWEAAGGILDEVEAIKKQKRYNDGLRAWNDIKPIEARLWNAILDASCNVIVTMRAKTAYEITTDESADGKKKTKVEKLGMAPIQRSDKEYEFDIVGRMEIDNTLVIEKSRCKELNGKYFHCPNGNVSEILKRWLSNGAPDTGRPAPAAHPDAEDARQRRELWNRWLALRDKHELDDAYLQKWMDAQKIDGFKGTDPGILNDLLNQIESALTRQPPAPKDQTTADTHNAVPHKSPEQEQAPSAQHSSQSPSPKPAATPPPRSRPAPTNGTKRAPVSVDF